MSCVIGSASAGGGQMSVVVLAVTISVVIVVVITAVNIVVAITGWAVALTCCISHIVKYRKKADFDSSGSQNRLTNFDETWHG